MLFQPMGGINGSTRPAHAADSDGDHGPWSGRQLGLPRLPPSARAVRVDLHKKANHRIDQYGIAYSYAAHKTHENIQVCLTAALPVTTWLPHPCRSCDMAAAWVPFLWSGGQAARA